ncbi:MAG: hypothetical protein H7177_02295 [Rhizobacter sp.]|nr:hypothetical protein [Bacteriovorax sp.]
MQKLIYLVVLILIFSLSGCGKKTITTSSEINAAYITSNASNYFSTTQKIVVEVYYEPGAEPFVGTRLNGHPYWEILEDNLKAIFKFRTNIPVIIVPKDQASMYTLPAQNKTTWTPDDIVALNQTYKQASPSATEAHFYIYFLKGNSSDSANVIAESINGTPVIGVFKSVITGSGSGIVQRYVEQSTIVHEMGHAIGFVNNGVPMKTPYQDTAHGNHSTNSNCVMYWQNEGQADLQNFVAHYISTGDNIMWGPEVMADAQAFSK